MCNYLLKQFISINDCITLTQLHTPLTFILVMMVLLFKTCMDLIEQCENIKN